MKKLLFARVLVLPIEGDEINKGALIVPAETENSPQYGKVVLAGTDVKHCVDGDTILYTRSAGDEVLINNTLHLIMNELDVLGII